MVNLAVAAALALSGTRGYLHLRGYAGRKPDVVKRNSPLRVEPLFLGRENPNAVCGLLSSPQSIQTSFCARVGGRQSTSEISRSLLPSRKNGKPGRRW